MSPHNISSHYRKLITNDSMRKCIEEVGSNDNQEDSLIMSRSAIEKGFFRAESLKKYIETIKKNQSSSQTGRFMKPDINRVDGMKRDGNYDTLTEEGFPKEETPIKDGDAIIGMVTPKSGIDGGKMFRDSSTLYKSIVPGAIDRVITGQNSDGYPIVKIRVRSERIPVEGDKFSARSGQKGTVGLRVHRADLPFTEKGLVPDIIINPNCMPKRMTIGQLVECVVSKLAVIKGIPGDATPFTGMDPLECSRELERLGYDPYCNEVMYNGITGKKLEIPIFIGPTYYQRLKQMVADKVHSRAKGQTQQLTRQPPHGRARDGGLRIGEMERDALCAHGIATFLKEKTVDNSDGYQMYVCDICGLQVAKKKKNNTYNCTNCDNQLYISRVVVPYTFKLLLQELRSIGILGRIRTNNYTGIKNIIGQ